MTPQRSADLAAVDVLVIDGANVVGSRPDGWWNDRAGAAARLYARVLAAAPLAPAVVLVLEGQARRGVAEGTTAGIRVVHAAAEGDDAIVEQVRQARAGGKATSVVTADRRLGDRVADLGGSVLRPGWLLDRLG